MFTSSFSPISIQVEDTLDDPRSEEVSILGSPMCRATVTVSSSPPLFSTTFSSSLSSSSTTTFGEPSFS